MENDVFIMVGGNIVLQNLNEIGISTKDSFQRVFRNEDFKLNREFKERFSEILESKRNTVRFYDYSAQITSSSNNKIYCPNQWFYIATFAVELVSELINYKNTLFTIIAKSEDIISRARFIEKIKLLKGKDMADFAPEIGHAINRYFQDDQESAEYMIKFITDYSWWSGSKTIDRPDFYVSPTLYLLGLVNVSQTYVADIVYYLASDNLLIEYARDLREQVEESSTKVSSPGTNIIVYGAPGTGKSNYLEEEFSNSTRVVFHSEYSYYDFVGGYKPTPLYKKTEDTLYRINGENFSLGEPVIDYQFRPGPFINVLINAFRSKDIKHTLLIEELNRANAAAVFGDVFQLLDRKPDGSSQYKIYPSEEIWNYLMSLSDVKQHFVDGIFIPVNMNIVATMNSADQGVFVLDSAFKRRWRFKYMPIKENGFVHEDSPITYGGEAFKWKVLLQAINGKLKTLGINEDRLIGPYFVSPDEIEDNDSFASKLLIYLWDDVIRLRREAFFDSSITTYSDLVSGFYDGKDVLNIKSDIYSLIDQSQS